MPSENALDNRTKLPLALELPTAVGLALMTGFIFNMSVVTAPALNELPPEQALAAWKRINSKVRHSRNPLFPLTVFGTGLLTLACTAASWRPRLKGWCLSSALLYWIGVIGTTFTVEAGINHAVVAATEAPPELPRMLSRWLAGNHVRAISAGAAFIVGWLGFHNAPKPPR